MAVLKTVVFGAAGKMGQEVVKGVLSSKDLRLVGAVDVNNVGKDIGEIIGIPKTGIPVSPNSPIALLESARPDVVIDFSNKEAAKRNLPEAIKRGISVVIGTTGLTENELDEIDTLAKQMSVGAFFAPNFSLGAVLMMRYARELAKYYPQAQIIEYHNDKKADSPSGTAIATARGMGVCAHCKAPESEKTALTSSLGDEYYGVRIHSVRLKSLIAHQEVLFAGDGELLTIRHDSFSRESFLPGILLAIRKVKHWQGLKIGLESLLN